MNDLPTYHLFERFGVEVEYMIVDNETLNVRPITDQLLHAVAKEFAAEIEMGDIAWSNELALHVIELKTNGPAESLGPLPAQFQAHVEQINDLLRPWNARLMPTGMHPWMDPYQEMVLWPHEYNAVYELFHQIFDCRGHGWANLQSTHLNLPFADDDEFGRLHAAIRLLLPIMPALAASSPVADGRLGMADNRLHVYRSNCRRIPSVTGNVVPEPVYTQAAYEERVLEPMYRDIRPHDPEGILQHEWLNARGAIARFGRRTLEIRVLDVQECPQADLAIATAITAVLHDLTMQRWTRTAEQQRMENRALERILDKTIELADEAVIDDRNYLRQFQVDAPRLSARELWQHLVSASGQAIARLLGETRGESSRPQYARVREALDLILHQGSLARRIRRRIGDSPAETKSVYRELCDCLAEGTMFAA